MPVEYLILPEIDLTYIRFKGHIQVRQIDLAFMSHLDDPDFRPGRSEFADLRPAVEFDMTFAEVSEHVGRLVHQYEIRQARVRNVIVATHPSVNTMAHAYAKLAERNHILSVEVFEDGAEAVKALDLPISEGELLDLVAYRSAFFGHP